MHWIDWLVLLLFLGYTIWDGSKNSKNATNLEGYLLAGRSMPWWAAGLSVMATQASAITFIGTTGLAYTQDMRFVQVYLAIPFAMVLISVFMVPYFHKVKAFSAYEVLEARFGLKTRLLTSSLFLISRGLALGTVIAAPAYVLSLLLGFPLTATILIIGVVATVYTFFGGVEGVIRTDVKQMSVMMFGLMFCFFWIWNKLPEGVGFGDSLLLAGTLNKLTALDLHFNLSEKYNVWSGVFAALFLMLSYFGADQTQVQRYLTARSVSDARHSLLLSAYAKVPMQFFILLLGVMLYVFFIFHPAPITFRAADVSSSVQTETQQQAEFHAEHTIRKERALELIKQPGPETKARFVESDKRLNDTRSTELKRQAEARQADVNDTNYIFPYFIITYLPVGIIGLIIAGIFAAAMSSIDSELNALTTVSMVDWWQRLRKKPFPESMDELKDVRFSRFVTLFWGIIATCSALLLGETKSIIELINQIGSYFYGSILGVFVLMFWFKKTDGTSAIAGLLSGMLAVFTFDRLYMSLELADYSFFLPWTSVPESYSKAVEFLWLNPLGTIVVVFVGAMLGLIRSRKS